MRRSGFTLIELLVVIAIIAVMIASCFCPPFKRLGRRRAWSQCVNNMKQIGLALHNYHDTMGLIPDGQRRERNVGHEHLQGQAGLEHPRGDPAPARRGADLQRDQLQLGRRRRHDPGLEHDPQSHGIHDPGQGLHSAPSDPNAGSMVNSSYGNADNNYFGSIGTTTDILQSNSSSR